MNAIPEIAALQKMNSACAEAKWRVDLWRTWRSKLLSEIRGTRREKEPLRLYFATDIHEELAWTVRALEDAKREASARSQEHYDALITLAHGTPT